jgi:ribokinase
MTPHILVIGDIVTDVVAVVDNPIAPDTDTPAQISVTGGGAGANAAAWLAHAGARVTLCGVVGADDAGDARLAELHAAGVTCAVRRAGGARTGSIVVISDGHQRTMLADRGANLLLTAADVDAALARAADAVHLHLSGYALLDAASRPAARHALAAARGLSTSVDAASAGPLRRVGGPEFLSWVRGTTLLLANADEANALVSPAMTTDFRAAPGGAAGCHGRVEAPEVVAAALAEVAGMAVVKLGGSGAVAARGTQTASVPAPVTDVVDPTGAGDAFAAGFLMAWLSGESLEVALRAGARLGAEAVSRVGARPLSS